MEKPIPKDSKRYYIKLQIIPEPGFEHGQKQEPLLQPIKKEPENQAFLEYLAKEVELFKTQCSEHLREKEALSNALNSYKLDKEVFSSKNTFVENEVKALREELEVIRKENQQLTITLALAEKENQDDYTAQLQMELREKKDTIDKIKTDNELLKERFKDKLDEYIRLREELRLVNESFSRAASVSPGFDSGQKPTFKLRIRHRSRDDSESSPNGD